MSQPRRTHNAVVTQMDASEHPTTRLFVPASPPRQSLQEDARWLLNLIAKHPELDRNGVSRLSKIAKTILGYEGEILEPSSPDFATALQGYKDLTELKYIFDILDPTTADRQLWMKIREVFGDTVLPSQSSPRKGARNTQFELLTWAMLDRSGMTPVHQGSGADFACSLGPQQFLVEAKRARGEKGLVELVGTAADQIQRGSLPGFILLDMSEAVNPGDKILALSDAPTDFPRVQRSRFFKLWNDFGSRIEAKIAGKGVLGITLFDHLIVQEGKAPNGAGRWMLYTIRDNRALPFDYSGGARLRENFFSLFSQLGFAVPLSR